MSRALTGLIIVTEYQMMLFNVHVNLINVINIQYPLPQPVWVNIKNQCTSTPECNLQGWTLSLQVTTDVANTDVITSMWLWVILIYDF